MLQQLDVTKEVVGHIVDSVFLVVNGVTLPKVKILIVTMFHALLITNAINVGSVLDHVLLFDVIDGYLWKSNIFFSYSNHF